MVLTSHHPLLTVIKQPVIRTGIYRCAENDSSESAGTFNEVQHWRKEKYTIMKLGCINACGALKHTNLCISENISPHVELRVQGHRGVVLRQC